MKTLRNWREFTAAADAFVAAHPGVKSVRVRAAELVQLCVLLRGRKTPLFMTDLGPGMEWRGLDIYCGERDQAEVFEAIPTPPPEPEAAILPLHPTPEKGRILPLVRNPQ